jgi:hypothetical protein
MVRLRLLLKLLHDEAAQNSFEYLLVLGGVAVLIMAALVMGFPAVVHAIVALACPSIDTGAVGPATYGSCLQ